VTASGDADPVPSDAEFEYKSGTNLLTLHWTVGADSKYRTLTFASAADAGAMARALALAELTDPANVTLTIPASGTSGPAKVTITIAKPAALAAPR
jgi:hypothetical protein